MKTELVYYGIHPIQVSDTGIVWDDMGKRMKRMKYKGSDNYVLLKTGQYSNVLLLLDSLVDAAFNDGVVKKAPISGQFLHELKTNEISEVQISGKVSFANDSSVEVIDIDYALHHLNPARRMAKLEVQY